MTIECRIVTVNSNQQVNMGEKGKGKGKGKEKGLYGKKRFVRFTAKEENEVVTIEHVEDLSEEQIVAVWYQNYEFDKIKRKVLKIIRRAEKKGNSALVDQERGLESCTQEGLMKRNKRRLVARAAVFSEQRRQDEEGTEDQDLIAKAYHTFTQLAAEEALELGLRDQEQVEQTHQNEMFHELWHDSVTDLRSSTICHRSKANGRSSKHSSKKSKKTSSKEKHRLSQHGVGAGDSLSVSEHYKQNTDFVSQVQTRSSLKNKCPLNQDNKPIATPGASELYAREGHGCNNDSEDSDAKPTIPVVEKEKSTEDDDDTTRPTCTALTDESSAATESLKEISAFGIDSSLHVAKPYRGKVVPWNIDNIDGLPRDSGENVESAALSSLSGHGKMPCRKKGSLQSIQKIADRLSTSEHGSRSSHTCPLSFTAKTNKTLLRTSSNVSGVSSIGTSDDSFACEDDDILSFSFGGELEDPSTSSNLLPPTMISTSSAPRNSRQLKLGFSTYSNQKSSIDLLLLSEHQRLPNRRALPGPRIINGEVVDPLSISEHRGRVVPQTKHRQSTFRRPGCSLLEKGDAQKGPMTQIDAWRALSSSSETTEPNPMRSGLAKLAGSVHTAASQRSKHSDNKQDSSSNHSRARNLLSWGRNTSQNMTQSGRTAMNVQKKKISSRRTSMSVPIGDGCSELDSRPSIQVTKESNSSRRRVTTSTGELIVFVHIVKSTRDQWRRPITLIDEHMMNIIVYP